VGDKIVGVSSHCNFPKEIENIEKVGSFSRPSLEKIVSLKPDIVFSAGIEQAPIIEKLQKFNVPVYIYCPQTINDILLGIRFIGNITDTRLNSERLISKMMDELVLNENEINDNSIKPRIYMEISEKPYITACEGTFINQLIKYAGGINIAKKGIKPFSKISEEKIIYLNPDIIILTHEKDSVSVKKRKGWQNINAIKNDLVITSINPDHILRAGPRICIAQKELSEIVLKFIESKKRDKNDE